MQKIEIVGIDPGPTKSATITVSDGKVNDLWYGDNNNLIKFLRAETYLKDIDNTISIYCIEGVSSYGMAVGKSVFDTVFWIGRFYQLLKSAGVPVYIVYRKKTNKEDNIAGVCRALCGNQRATKTNTKYAVMDMFEQTGGGARPAIGTKKQPGPLFATRQFKDDHIWSALDVAMTYSLSDNFKNKEYLKEF